MRKIIEEILMQSLNKLYQEDFDNIKFGVSERNICARLAHHMENMIRQWDKEHDSQPFSSCFVDVEYNRMGNGDLKHYENSEHRPRYMVSDLLIQRRAHGGNFLAVEMKRKGNKKNVDKDKERLSSLVCPSTSESRNDCVHNTLLGAFIVYSIEGVDIDLFSYSHEQHGVIVEKRLYIWNSNSCKLVLEEYNRCGVIN